MKSPANYLENAKRIVIKVGTNIITTAQGNVDAAYCHDLASQIHSLRKEGKEIIIVTSGAIGAGMHSLKISSPVEDIVLRQTCAAVGQDILMSTWREAFSKHDLQVAQILLTYDCFTNKVIYFNLVQSFDMLLHLGIIPIVNENDVIATQEIDAHFGDNDQLSAMVASKSEADALIILSDIDGLYTSDPHRSRKASRISVVPQITAEIEAMAGGPSVKGRGGMKTKIEAAKMCSQAGVQLVISQGREAKVLTRLFSGEVLGTIFLPQAKLPHHQRWLKLVHPRGAFQILPEKTQSLKNKKRLEAGDIISVEGTFEEGDVVSIKSGDNLIAKGSSEFAADEAREFQAANHQKLLIREENLVFM